GEPVRFWGFIVRLHRTSRRNCGQAVSPNDSYRNHPRRGSQSTQLPSEATGFAADTEEAGGHKVLAASHASRRDLRTRAPILNRRISLRDLSPVAALGN